MIKGLIAAVILIAVLWGAWEIWLYWDQVSHDRDLAAQKDAQSTQIATDQLQGMPSQALEKSYQAALKSGPTAVKNWLKNYGQSVADPRRAGIELDYALSISRDEPAEAKRIFAEVKSRVTETSPLYPRVKKLENTYQ